MDSLMSWASHRAVLDARQMHICHPKHVYTLYIPYIPFALCRTHDRCTSDGYRGEDGYGQELSEEWG